MEKMFSDNNNTATIQTSDDNNFEYKCMKVPKNTTDNFAPNIANADVYNNGATTTDNNVKSENIEGFEQFMNSQEKQNNEMKHVVPIKTSSENNVLKPIVANVETVVTENASKPVYVPVTTSETKSETKSENVATTSEDLTYSVNYVQYQQDGLQQDADKQSAKVNEFRREIADQEAVIPWTKEGYKYYADIFTRSVGAPPADEALTNELKYGDYNYVGPINKGMINKEYTFVSPTNWYPIPPHPPVCVTNKSCTTCPIQISNGKDYMNFASWDEFDKARRFTGDMGINIDYVKNVLNNPNSF